MIGAFCFEETWRGWTPERLADELRGIRALGVDAIVTETVEPPDDLVRGAHEAGLRTYVSVPCFSAHGWPHLTEGMDLHPVLADGRPRPTMEWYTGLIPTHSGYVRGLLGRIARIAAARPAGVILDFVRWPLHWELELRAGAPEPLEASFDGRSLRAFAAWLRWRGLRHEGELEPAALTGPLRDRWTEFKCDVITRFAGAAARSVRAMGSDIVVGAFIVPGTHEQRRRLLGQDVAALGACLDLLLPMTYHAILHEDVSLVGRVAREVRERTAAEVIPVVQVTAEREVAGPWDWGPELPPRDFGRAVGEALRVAPGVILFPLEGLSEERREVLAASLASRRGSGGRPP